MHRNNIVADLSTGELLIRHLKPYSIVDKGNELDLKYFYKWLNGRAAPLNRKNVDKIYKAAGLPRENSYIDLMIQTHALSINDNYWICRKDEVDKFDWDSINLYKNKLSESLRFLAFTGTGPATIAGELSPEFTGQGTYAKCIRRKNNKLEICKQGTNNEITAEIMTSYICRLLGIKAIDYKFEVVDRINASVSEIYTNEDISWESAFNFAVFSEEYYSKNIYDFAEEYWKKEYYQMVLIDGLTLNEDRHLKNWSIEISGRDNSILGLAPLYDFNKAFTGDIKSRSPMMPKRNLLEAAKIANEYLQYDLVTSLFGVINYLPEKWRDSYYNRILYITGTKQSQNGCY